MLKESLKQAWETERLKRANDNTEFLPAALEVLERFFLGSAQHLWRQRSSRFVDAALQRREQKFGIGGENNHALQRRVLRAT